MAEAILRTREVNQLIFTIVEGTVLSPDWNENWRVVAVILEKKIATVAKSMNEFRKWSCFLMRASSPKIQLIQSCV